MNASTILEVARTQVDSWIGRNEHLLNEAYVELDVARRRQNDFNAIVWGGKIEAIKQENKRLQALLNFLSKVEEVSV